MRGRWTAEAADDFARIVEFIREDNPEAARRVAATVFDAVAGLRRFPYRGRPGLVADTRELVFGRDLEAGPRRRGRRSSESRWQSVRGRSRERKRANARF